ncbi:DNA helicase UvrD [Patescibacteria group bacterium]|nr:MAG: DNA helicase UvrD [Patescibacteria group bacterium]
MRYIADLHIHSKYSRACSKELVPENIDLWCRIKGIDLVATADFTHPKWFAELSEKLEPAESGLYCLKKEFRKSDPHFLEKTPRNVRFILGTELSCIYKKSDKTRRVHHLVFAPSMEIVEKINAELEKRDFNLKSDGRPILGIDSENLLEILLEIDERIVLIPAHAWTPWFAIFGSRSGFDSIEECFGSTANKIFAIETGLSSDPPMNWKNSWLDSVALISNSDAHSLQVLGREANIFEGEKISYNLLFEAIKKSSISGRAAKKNNAPLQLIKTVEFYPDEGRYHYDGHANCKIALHPREAKKIKNICPTCGKPLTLGVLHRTEELADRKEAEIPKDRAGFIYSVELEKIIAEAVGVRGRRSKAVERHYWDLINKFGGELPLLLDAEEKELNQAVPANIVEAIRRVRSQELQISPGYDGEYGIVKIFKDNETITGRKNKQSVLL